MNAMSKKTSGPGDDIYPYDFVEVDVDGREVETGRVVGVPVDGCGIYSVQVFDGGGPTGRTVDAYRDEVQLHPEGRLAVLDSSSNSSGKDT